MHRFLVFPLVIMGFSSSPAADWPRFLGLKGNAISGETEWNDDWRKKEPEPLWTEDVGIGCSSVAIAGGFAYTVGHPRRDDEIIWCLDAVTGKEKWKFKYKHDLEPKYYSGGPSATPTVDEGRLFALSKDGDLRCLDAATGALLWQKSYVRDFGGREPTWGYAASPIVVGDLLICEPGGHGASAVALKKTTGAEVWRTGGDLPGYATPLICESPNGPFLVFFNRSGLSGHDLQGLFLFRIPWRTQNDVNAASPLQHGDGFLISSGYGSGSAFFRIANGKASEVWRSKKMTMQFQNMIARDGHAFFVNGENSTRASIQCVEISTGKVKWDDRLSGNRGSIIMAGGKLLALSENGELALGEASADGFNQTGRIQANRKTCWAPLSFANGLFYCRNNDGRLVCLDMRK